MTAPLPLTISERVRRMDAPTLPPRYSAFALYEGEDAALLGRNEDPELLLLLAGNEIAENGYDVVDVAIVANDNPICDVYRQIVHTRDDGTQVIREPIHLRTDRWCPRCETCHGVSDCGGES